MFFSVFLSYLPYACVTAFTPGPNNILSMFAVSQHGWRDGKKVISGIAAGFICVMLLCALFCYELAKWIPSVTHILKYVGAAYILRLAYHIACSRPENEKGRTISFGKGFFLQFANVKIILSSITIYTGYILPENIEFTTLMLHALCLTVVGMSGTIIWAAMGGALQKFLQKYYKPFNITMASILIYCAITMIFDL